MPESVLLLALIFLGEGMHFMVEVLAEGGEHSPRTNLHLTLTLPLRGNVLGQKSAIM
jgi:hypothetical protein